MWHVQETWVNIFTEPKMGLAEINILIHGMRQEDRRYGI